MASVVHPTVSITADPYETADSILSKMANVYAKNAITIHQSPPWISHERISQLRAVNHELYNLIERSASRKEDVAEAIQEAIAIVLDTREEQELRTKAARVFEAAK